MKKIIIAALLLAASFVQAQKIDNSLLWKISGNGLTKPSYLFGTIHITCNATLDKNVLNAMDATTQLYLELDADDPGMQAAMMGSMMMKDGKKMSTMTSAEDFKIVDDFLVKNTGMPATMMDTFKPFILSSMLAPKMIDCPVQSIEAELMKVSQAQKEEVYGLETVDFQMGVFDAIPYQDQMDELVKTAKDDMAGDKKEFAEMMALYNNKDLNGLFALMNSSQNKMYAGFNDILLDNRNKTWISKIEETAKKTPTFFGVGAAHLPGENGVINLLRKKGYKVEAVQ